MPLRLARSSYWFFHFLSIFVPTIGWRVTITDLHKVPPPVMFHPRSLHGMSPSLPLRPSPERSPPKLCENGRAYVTHPSTGQPVCLCQLDAHTAHGVQTHPALRGVRTLTSPRPGFREVHGYHTQISAMTPLAEQTNGLLPAHIAFHPYGAMYAGMDMNGGPIRKAATRETTGPLKAWLSEHKKNPYPTKAEKIMLAIITRMTLTQVSTWFANARRRLKKDNRLPEGDGVDDGVSADSDREGDSDSVSVDVSVNAEREVKVALRGDAKFSSEGEADPDSFSDISDDENDVFQTQSRDTSQPIVDSHVPVITSSPSMNQSASKASVTSRTETSTGSRSSSATPETPKPKPKIWSISHILDS